jgi:hypothetical protein
MHVAGALADRRLPELAADAEGDKQRTTLRGAPYGDQAVPETGVLRIRGNPGIAAQQRFDLGNRDAVFATVRSVVPIPIE